MAKKKKARKKAAEVDPLQVAAQAHAGYNLSGSPERGRTRLSQLQNVLGRRFGSFTALTLDAAPVARVMRLPFGILMLDWKTGGVVIGRINRLQGKKSTLKSTLCLRVLVQAQNTCRHCKFPIVVNPMTGEVDCSCPSPRWWLAHPDDYSWMEAKDAITISYGRLPEGVTWKKIKGMGDAKQPVLNCKPPPHAMVNKDGSEKANKPKAKDVLFVPMERCEPWRCIYLDSEMTIDEAWARANGVDTSLVLLVGSRWAEQSLESLEEAVLSKEFDLLIIDSTSMLQPRGEVEKSLEAHPKVAAKAALMGRWVMRHVSNMMDGGLTSRYVPTILCTSQMTMKGLGGGIRPYLGPTDGNRFDHALSLDIRMTAKGYKMDEAGEHAVYGKFDFEVKKNKAGGSIGAKASIHFWVREVEDHAVGDSDDLATVMEYARELGDGFILERKNKKDLLTLTSRYVVDGSVVFSKVGDCTAFLKANPTVYNDLRTRVLARLREADLPTLQVAQPAHGVQLELLCIHCNGPMTPTGCERCSGQPVASGGMVMT